MKKFKLFFAGFLAVGVAGALTAASSYAAEFIVPPRQEANVTVSAGETHRNLYVVGGNVTVNSVTEGDLVAAGALVNVVGDVEEDVMVAGGSLSLAGAVGGDVRLAGGNVFISSQVGGDLVLGAGNVSITSKAQVGGDLVLGAGNIVIDAPVRGNVKIAGGNVTINSRVEGNVQVWSDSKKGGLVFGPSAEILGKVTYKGPKEAVVKEGAKISEIEYIPTAGQKGSGKALKTLFTLGLLIKLLAWIIAGLVLVKLMKKRILAMVKAVQEKPWTNLGLGLAGVVVVPIAVILLFVTLVGYYLGILLGIWYVLALAFVCVLASLVLGYWILKYLSKKDEIKDWQAVVIGVVVWQLLKFIPVLGWLVLLLVFLMTFGALMLSVREKMRQDN